MREFLEFIVRHLVDHPELVVIDQVEAESTVTLTLRVGPGEVGRVIGRSGRTAQALRVLLSAAAARQGRRALLEIAGS
jgi:predicted RNA-binding protein YlqC (UPF0109 family)